MRKAHSMLPCTLGLLMLVGSYSQINAQVGTCSGCLDATFGSSGNGLVVTSAEGSGSATANALAIETVTQNGVAVQKIVAAVNGSYFAVARYNMDGSLDTSFNGSGIVVTNISGYAYGLAIQSDGKILVGGDENVFGVAIVRLNTDGSLDTSFGSSGVALIPNGKKSGVEMTGMQIQNDGKLVVVGGSVWRLTSNGTLDTTFGSGGAVSIVFGNGSTMLGRAVGLQNVTVNGTVEQMIVICGAVVLGNGKNQHSVFALLRLTPSGHADTTFGSGGGVISSTFPGIPFALTIDSSNNIIAVGGANGVVAAARYSENGSADGSFGSDGYTSFTPIVAPSSGYAVAVQSDGRVVIGGYTSRPAGSPGQMFVARLTTTGALDGNFGTGGCAVPYYSSLGYNEGYGYSVLVQPADGKIVLGGLEVLDPHPSVLALARYLP